MPRYDSSYCYICVLVLLCMCPHTTACVSLYYRSKTRCTDWLLVLLHMCPHTTAYVSLYYYTCVLILLRMCPHTTTHVSSYYCVCARILQVQDTLHRLVARAAAEATSARTRSNEAKELVAADIYILLHTRRTDIYTNIPIYNARTRSNEAKELVANLFFLLLFERKKELEATRIRYIMSARARRAGSDKKKKAYGAPIHICYYV
jgi:hypothetical protein